MRRLSGWARLWIVCSALWWLGAGTVTGLVVYQGRPWFAPLEDVCIAESPRGARGRAAVRECVDRLSSPSAQAAAMQERSEITRRYWIDRAPIFLVVAIAPFLAALLFSAIQWVWRGFRPQSN
jgi:hypothetical protein